MPLNLQQKQAVVTEVAEVASTAHSVIAAEYQGLTVADMTVLRASARESNVFLKVVKNTLAKRTFGGTDYESAYSALMIDLKAIRKVSVKSKTAKGRTVN